jgi:hypothetical protein
VAACQPSLAARLTTASAPHVPGLKHRSRLGAGSRARLSAPSCSNHSTIRRGTKLYARTRYRTIHHPANTVTR